MFGLNPNIADDASPAIFSLEWLQQEQAHILPQGWPGFDFQEGTLLYRKVVTDTGAPQT